MIKVGLHKDLFSYKDTFISVALISGSSGFHFGYLDTNLKIRLYTWAKSMRPMCMYFIDFLADDGSCLFPASVTFLFTHV